ARASCSGWTWKAASASHSRPRPAGGGARREGRGGTLNGRQYRRVLVPRVDHLPQVAGIEVQRIERQRLPGLEEPDPHLSILGPELRQVVLQAGDAQIRAAHLAVHDVDGAQEELRDRVRVLDLEWRLGERVGGV